MWYTNICVICLLQRGAFVFKPDTLFKCCCHGSNFVYQHLSICLFQRGVFVCKPVTLFKRCCHGSNVVDQHLCYLFIAERGVCVWTGNSRQASWAGQPGVDDGEVREQDNWHARHVRGTKGGRRPATGTWQWRFRHGLCPLLCMKYLCCWFSWIKSVIFFINITFKILSVSQT